MKVLIIRILHFFAKVYWKVFKPNTIGVRCIARDEEGDILLIKNQYGFDKEKWRLPGGGVKRKELPNQAVTREMKEETGYDLNNIELNGIFLNEIEGKRDYIFVFLGVIYGKENINSPEISEVKFWPLERLPNMSPATQRRLKEYLRKEKKNNEVYQW